MKYIGVLFLLVLSAGCGKQFLDVRPVANVVIPETVDDFEALLDASTGMMNANSTHALGLIGGDEFYVSDQIWNTPNQFGPPAYQRLAYIWDLRNLYEPITQDPDWNLAYRRIVNANIALEGEARYGDHNDDKWKVIKGRALFFRALNYYQLAQIFCKGYNEATAKQDKGLPLKLVSDLTTKPSISNLDETYGQIEKDILEAVELLPETETLFQRPSKLAAYALLARMYLNQGKYDEALRYCDRILAINDNLFNFNKLDMSSNPFNTFSGINHHPEIIFAFEMRGIEIASYGYFNADTVIYNMYDNNDLRKEVFFMDYSGTTMFRGGYQATGAFFSGFATDEIHLIKAEILARKKITDEALHILNFLRSYRFKEGHLSELKSDKPEEVLDWVLRERRLELFVRGVRWEDLKRLGTENGTGIELERNLNGVRYSVTIDRNFVWPMPRNVMDLGGY